MNMRILCCGVLGVVIPGLVGCDMNYADDTVEKQELGRMNRGIPAATELPPGLGEDLPAASGVEATGASTQPISKSH